MFYILFQVTVYGVFQLPGPVHLFEDIPVVVGHIPSKPNTLGWMYPESHTWYYSGDKLATGQVYDSTMGKDSYVISPTKTVVDGDRIYIGEVVDYGSTPSGPREMHMVYESELTPTGQQAHYLPVHEAKVKFGIYLSDKAFDSADIMNTLNHEITHGIQKYLELNNGFSPGKPGSWGANFYSDGNALQKQINEVVKMKDPAARQAAATKGYEDMLNGYYYQLSAGELHARAFGEAAKVATSQAAGSAAVSQVELNRRAAEKIKHEYNVLQSYYRRLEKYTHELRAAGATIEPASWNHVVNSHNESSNRLKDQLHQFRLESMNFNAPDDMLLEVQP